MPDSDQNLELQIEKKLEAFGSQPITDHFVIGVDNKYY
jgi:hypothetical protein